MTEIVESPLNTAVSPQRVLTSHAYGQVGYLPHGPRTTRRTTLVGPLLGNQLPVPAKDCVGCNDAGDLAEDPSAELLPLRREPPSLVVGEPEPLSAELLFEDPVLFAQIIDRRLLVFVDPASEDRDEELPWLEDLSHPPSLRLLPSAARLHLASAKG
jgi:hypothetical protein